MTNYGLKFCFRLAFLEDSSVAMLAKTEQDTYVFLFENG